MGISSACKVAAAIKVASKRHQPDLIATILRDHGGPYCSRELCGVEESDAGDERDHPLDDHILEMLDQYQEKWEVIRWA